MHLSARQLGQTLVEWQAFEKPENKRQMYGLGGLACHSAAFWPTALKLRCITNFNMLFLVIGFISLVDEI